MEKEPEGQANMIFPLAKERAIRTHALTESKRNNLNLENIIHYFLLCICLYFRGEMPLLFLKNFERLAEVAKFK